MCEIKEWLKDHPAISIRRMEKDLMLPVGIVRVMGEKPIPLKYKEDIKKWLVGYGMINDCVPMRKQYFLRQDHLVYKEEGLWRRKNIDDNTPLYIE